MTERESGGEYEPKPFDSETEKTYRQELRKELVNSLNTTLGTFGFEKIGNSLWGKQVNGNWQLVHLQRSQFGHHYYINVGITDPNFLPAGEKPRIEHCHYRNSKRIEGIVFDAMTNTEDPAAVAAANENRMATETLLDFEAPNVAGEDIVPSVPPEEAKEKIAMINERVREFVPTWFEEHTT